MKPAEGQRLAAVAVGKQSEVADLDEAGRQNMEQEAADELDRIEPHDAAAVVVPGVAPSETHLTVVEAEQSSVRDGDPMRVAGQILQHLFRCRMGVWSRPPTLFGARYQAECEMRVVLIAQPACRRSIVRCAGSSA